MLVCYIHEVILEGVVVMVLEPAWRELACRNFDVWLGETGLGISTQLPCDSWRTLKTCQRMSDNGGGSLGSHFNDGKGGLIAVELDVTCSPEKFTLFGSIFSIK